jgi:aminoglycoside phosphotransferase (APT) family kinase protein
MTKGSLLARGRRGEIYAWEDGRVLKLYDATYRAEDVAQELAFARQLHAAGLPVPAVYGTQTVDGRQGIIYERLDGPLLDDLLGPSPALWRIPRQMAELHVQIHQRSLPGLRSLKDALRYDIQHAPDDLPPALRDKTLALLERRPAGEALLHYDFHVQNIIQTAGGPRVVDWEAVRSGHPLADVARSRYLFLYSGDPNEEDGGGWLSELARRLVTRLYTRHYCRLSGATLADIQRWEPPVFAARMSEGIPEEHPRIIDVLERHPALRNF